MCGRQLSSVLLHYIFTRKLRNTNTRPRIYQDCLKKNQILCNFSFHLFLYNNLSWCWVVPLHSTAWLCLFPYKRLRRSTGEISKGKVLGYYRNLGFLRYGTVFLAVLWAALLSRIFEEIWDAAAKRAFI